jgi:hypothetical protein
MNQGLHLMPITGFILPYPERNNLYMIIQNNIDHFNPCIVFTPKYSIIDVNYNNYLGDVTVKDVEIVRDSVCKPICATRHSNGRDWWIILRKMKSSTYYSVLLNPAGLHIYTQRISLPADDTIKASGGTSFFSSDGSRYYEILDTINISTHMAKLATYDFDRSTGILSNYKQILLDDSISLNIQLVCTLSPNGRFLYIATHDLLQQYDLLATDVAASQTILDTVDWTVIYPGGGRTDHSFSTLGPDGKIYISSTSKCVHVIHNPDLPGTQCNFKKCDIDMLFRSRYFPVYPNFRLGAVVGLMEYTNNIENINISPNPATSNINFDIQLKDNYKAMTFRIYNPTGDMVHETYFAPFQSVVNFNVSAIPAGIYQAILSDNSLVRAKGRFAVVH